MADRVVVLDQGTITANGVHAAVYQNNMIYRRFCDQQIPAA